MSENLELLSSLAESGWADSMTMGTDETADGSPTAVASDVLRWAVAEIARLRLTDAEREAVECGISYILDAEYYGGPGWPSRDPGPDEPLEVVALRGLLERLK